MLQIQTMYTLFLKVLKTFLKLLDSNSHCVMEATGYYYCQLAYFFTGQCDKSIGRESTLGKAIYSDAIIKSKDR